MTAEEFFKTPESNLHIELVDGEIITYGSQSGIHHDIKMGMYLYISDYIKNQKHEYSVFTMPSDVPFDEYNVVQPDIYVTDEKIPKEAHHITSVPPFIAEICDPYNDDSDNYLKKLYMYAMNGVKEYWIIDPSYKRVMVYRLFDESHLLNVYTFDQHIPVGIWNDELKICVNDLLA